MNNLFNLGAFFKFLGKNKSYTAIDIFGLAVSLMFVVLITVYVVQEISTDRFHKHADRIYVLGSEENFGTAYRLAERIKERYPEIEAVCPMAPWSSREGGSLVSIADVKLKAKLLFADTTFFHLFSFKLNGVDPARVMEAKNYAVISKSFARKAFGNENPLGQTIVLNDSVSVLVNGVMDDIRNSSVPYCDILVRIDNIKYFNWSMDMENFSNAGSAYIFILEKEGADLQAKADDMAAWFKEIFWIYKKGIYEKVTFTPLKEVHFSELNRSELESGDWKFVMILMSVGLLILIFAVINYINLTVAQAGFRAKEMAMRRLLGASRSELFVRLILESTLLCFISFVAALFLAFLCVPYADTLLETRIDLNSALTPLGILISIGVILILGVISGWLPAILISNAQPIEITRGSFSRKMKMVFSKFFITFQNVITIMLLVASITMVAQTLYLIHAPLGYNTVNIIDVGTDKFDGKGDISTFVNEVKQLASVKRVALSAGTPFNRGNNNTTAYKTEGGAEKNISFQILKGDTAYFEMLGFQKLRENNSADPNCAYLNEQAMRETELSEDAQELKIWGNIPIGGIIKDFQLRNVTNRMEPLLFQYSNFENDYPWGILIEIQGDPVAAREQVKAIYERITEVEFDGKFIDEQVEESFASQRRTYKIICVFTVIAVLISLLGLLAMSTYFIRQRTREVAVRKALGAENFTVLSNLVWTFLRYVGIAFVIATPVSWYIMQRWLSDYSYRIQLSPLIFLAAGGFCLLVSFISVYWQSRKAAHANPVEALKSI